MESTALSTIAHTPDTPSSDENPADDSLPAPAGPAKDKPKPGRPFALDDDKRSDICTLLTAGCGIEQAAGLVGCSPNTIRRDARRNPEFGERLRFAERQSQLKSLHALREAADKHWRAAAWMLDRQLPNRHRRRRTYAMAARQMGQFITRIEAIIAFEIEAEGPRERILRRVKEQVFEFTELV